MFHTPGIHSPEQVEGWKPVVEAVHRAGSKIFLQLWHVGRISHPLFQPNGDLPVAPSAIAPKGDVFTPEGKKPYVAPRALETSEIPGIVDDLYRTRGAKNALAAGFDGVEVHGANGVSARSIFAGWDQSAHRSLRRLGGKPRASLARGDAGRGRCVGARPRGRAALAFRHIQRHARFRSGQKTFSYAISALDALEIVYVHLREGTEDDVRQGGSIVPADLFRPLFQGALILNGGYNRERADVVIAKGLADMVAFGAPRLSPIPDPSPPHVDRRRACNPNPTPPRSTAGRAPKAIPTTPPSSSPEK